MLRATINTEDNTYTSDTVIDEYINYNTTYVFLRQ